MFGAARRAGIRNIVWASSETVLGLPFDSPRRTRRSTRSTRPRPESTYSLGKALDEEMARHFCRWDPQLKMIGLRFSNVMEPADYAALPVVRRRPAAADGTSGATSTPATAPRRSASRWSPPPACEVFIVANADTVMTPLGADLMAEYFPTCRPGRIGRTRRSSSIDKARRLLGYEPQHSWRDEASRG